MKLIQLYYSNSIENLRFNYSNQAISASSGKSIVTSMRDATWHEIMFKTVFKIVPRNIAPQ